MVEPQSNCSEGVGGRPGGYGSCLFHFLPYTSHENAIEGEWCVTVDGAVKFCIVVSELNTRELLKKC